MEGSATQQDSNMNYDELNDYQPLRTPQGIFMNQEDDEQPFYLDLDNRLLQENIDWPASTQVLSGNQRDEQQVQQVQQVQQPTLYEHLSSMNNLTLGPNGNNRTLENETDKLANLFIASPPTGNVTSPAGCGGNQTTGHHDPEGSQARRNSEDNFAGLEERLRVLGMQSGRIIERSGEFLEIYREISHTLTEKRGLENEIDGMIRECGGREIRLAEGAIGIVEGKRLELERILRDLEDRLELVRVEMLRMMDENWLGIVELQSILLGDPLERLRKQLLHNDRPWDDDDHLLAKLDSYMETLINLVLSLRRQAIKMYRFSPPSNARKRIGLLQDGERRNSLDINILINCIDRSLNDLICECFIINVQPPPVVKTYNQFEVSVRLIGGNIDLIRRIGPTVKVALVDQPRACEALEEYRAIVERSSLHNSQRKLQQPQQRTKTGANANCESLNLTKFKSANIIGCERHNLEYNDSTREVLCHFKKLKLEKVDRKSGIPVTEEKYCLLFYTKYILSHDQNDNTNDDDDEDGDDDVEDRNYTGNNVTTHHLIAFSQPMVVIVSGVQDMDACATATWHQVATTKTDGPPPYILDDKIEWLRLFQALSRKFESLSSKRNSNEYLTSSRIATSRGLSREKDGSYLLKIISLNSMRQDIPSGGVSSTHVSWNQFAKENLADKEFTFWKWFYQIHKLVHDHFIDYWIERKIEGFISKADTYSLLCDPNKTIPIGTFVIRFSEQVLGAVALSWKKASGEVEHLFPLTGKDLDARSLAERIGDDLELKFLYPGIAKGEAFGLSSALDRGQTRNRAPIGYTGLELRQVRL